MEWYGMVRLPHPLLHLYDLIAMQARLIFLLYGWHFPPPTQKIKMSLAYEANNLEVMIKKGNIRYHPKLLTHHGKIPSNILNGATVLSIAW